MRLSDIYNVRECPRCKSDDISVVDCRLSGGLFNRTRKCNNCNYLYHTIEVFVGQDFVKVRNALKQIEYDQA